MSTIVFDIETNGLIDTVSTIHCLCFKDTYKDEVQKFSPKMVELGLCSMGTQATQLVGHNIIGFDLEVIHKLYPDLKFTGDVFDTMICSQLVFPNMYSLDARGRWQYKVPEHLWGKHSLEAWGYRLGFHKGDYGKQENAWEKYTPEMLEYCANDVLVNEALYEYLLGEEIPYQALHIEQQFQFCINKQEQRGILVDQDAMMKNVGILQPKVAELLARLQDVFPARFKDKGEFIPKTNNAPRGYMKDCPFHKIELVEFNPNSSAHIRERLGELGWTPVGYTKKSKEKYPNNPELWTPSTTEEDIEDFDHPSVKVLLEYKKVTNCLTKIYTGEASWYNNIGEDGRLHGGIYAFGTQTRRCSHSPNTTQLSKNEYFEGTSLEGKITPRDMCIPSTGMVQVGADASCLELCCLAHYVNDPAYTHVIVSGKSEDGTDIHSLNMKSSALIKTRPQAKKFIYAFNYGAGNAKLGAILGGNAETGKQAREQFLEANPKLQELVENVKKVAKERGYIYTIDGSKIYVPKGKEYVAFNYLLQSCGAIIMKVAYIHYYSQLQATGLERNKDYAIIMYNHDEFQIECLPEHAKLIGDEAVKAITNAGEYLSLKCPLTGDYKIGKNWAECH